MRRSKSVLFNSIFLIFITSNSISYLYSFICDSVDVVLLQPKLNLKISSLRSRVSVFDPIYSEEYGLLIKNVPRKKLKDISIPFV